MPQYFIDALDDTPLKDRVQSFKGGANGFTTPVELQADESQVMENLFVENNWLAKTRAGADALTGGSIPAGGKCQGLWYFESTTVEQLITIVNRVASYWNGTTWTTMVGYTPSSASTLMVAAQGNNVIYFSDGVGQWYSWDGTTFTALGTGTGAAGDPPVGATVMCWHTNRMFAAGVAGYPDTVWVSNILDGGANVWNDVLWSFRIGGGGAGGPVAGSVGDPIIGMVSLPNYYLLVICQNSIYIVNANPQAGSAAEWEIHRLPSNIGGKSKRCIIGTMNEAYFLADDGIRSVRRMQAVGTQYEVALPLSTPMQPYIDRINWAVAYKSCAWVYNQFVFFALPLDAATEPSHVIVFNERTQSWMGVWTGWTPTQFATTFFSDTTRLCFGDASGNINLWKDYLSESLDSTYTDNGVSIASSLTSRAFNMGEPANMKDSFYFELRLVDTTNLISVALYLDNVNIRQWQVNADSSGLGFPISFPFNFSVSGPYVSREALDGLTEWDEAYVVISAAEKKMVIKNFTLAAYLNTLASAQQNVV